MELALTPHDSPDGGLHYVVSGKGINFSMSEGLAGGYAGAPNSYVWVHNNESPEGSNVDASFALGLDEMAGRQEPISWGVFPLMGKDALYVRWNGGGGYGDPLDREPEAVLSDCRAGLVTREVARNVYGVVMSDDMGSLDLGATESARRSLAVARGARRAAE
jgi:N-methylhydantoinase B